MRVVPAYLPRAQFLWVGGSLSCLEQTSLRSFVAHGYPVDLYAYTEIDGVPPGVNLCAAETILPARRIFRQSSGWAQGSYAGFADLFRYHLLRQKGGWWFDADIISIRPLPAPAGLRLASSFEGGYGQLANNCAIYAPVGHPALNWLCENAETALQTAEPEFGALGPYLVQRMVRELGCMDAVAPWWEFSPFPHTQLGRVVYARGARTRLIHLMRHVKYQIRALRDPDFRVGRLRPGTRALHLHNEIWRSSGWAKNGSYHAACLFESLKRRHGIACTAP